MRPILQLVSTVAVGFVIATIVAVAGAEYLPLGPPGSAGIRLDYGSLGLGLVIGIGLSSLARIAWAEMPRRFVAWLVGQRGTFQLLTLGAACAAVLMLY